MLVRYFVSSERGAQTLSETLRVVFRIDFRVFRTSFVWNYKHCGRNSVLQTCPP